MTQALLYQTTILERTREIPGVDAELVLGLSIKDGRRWYPLRQRHKPPGDSPRANAYTIQVNKVICNKELEPGTELEIYFTQRES